MQTNLKEKLALVTGASSGLGAQFARVLAANGATVALAARRIDRLKELRSEIEAAGGAAHIVHMDVNDTTSIAAAVETIERECGAIDILINNAGVGSQARLTDVTPEEFERVFATNVRGAFFTAQAVAARMLLHAREQPEFRGRIINIASVAGLKVVANLGLYCMSKAAVVQMTKAQALEWGRYGINVNAICPGYIRTEINEHHWDTDAGRKLLAMLPRRRLGDASDLDALLLLLAAPESEFINGAVIAADDGLSVF